MAVARSWVATGLKPMPGDALTGGRAMLDREAGHAAARHAFKLHAMSGPSQMIEICNAARAGSADAEIALYELHVAFEDRGEQPPMLLRAFMIELADPKRLRPHRQKGKHKADHYFQDVIITAIIIELIAKHGLHPTRRKLSDRPSACSVVAAALAERGIHRGGEKAIEKIWQKWGYILTGDSDWNAVFPRRPKPVDPPEYHQWVSFPVRK